MSFPYSSDDENRPEKLKWSKCKVACKQPECWTLMRLLPLIIGGYVQEGNETWEILLTYLTIVRMIISQAFTEGELVLLQCSIESWLKQFKRRFGSIRTTPKMHFLLHYPEQIRKHGALVTLCTLRYEHKHQQLKSFGRPQRTTKTLHIHWRSVTSCGLVPECAQMAFLRTKRAWMSASRHQWMMSQQASVNRDTLDFKEL